MKTYRLVDPATQRTFVGVGATVEAAFVDALEQMNAATAARLRIRYSIQEYAKENA